MIISLTYIKDMGPGVSPMVVDASMTDGSIRILSKMDNKDIFSGDLEQLKAIAGKESDEGDPDGLATEIYTDMLGIIEKFEELLTKK